MERGARIRISPDGSLQLPKEVLEKLGWRPGSYLEFSVEAGALHLRRVEVDPFAEAIKKPDADAFEQILSQQKKSQEAAFRTFEERVKAKDFPELKPEDKPDFWW
jgi:AbrB family looped-hinge helix DNA binding protein